MRPGPGAPRKADSVLMAIRALVMEFEHEYRYAPAGERKVLSVLDCQTLIKRIKAAYGHGGKMVAQMYEDHLKQIDSEIHVLGEKHFRKETE